MNIYTWIILHLNNYTWILYYTRNIKRSSITSRSNVWRKKLKKYVFYWIRKNNKKLAPLTGAVPFLFEDCFKDNYKFHVALFVTCPVLETQLWHESCNNASRVFDFFRFFFLKIHTLTFWTLRFFWVPGVRSFIGVIEWKKIGSNYPSSI